MSCYRKANGNDIMSSNGVDSPCNPAAAVSPCCPITHGAVCLESFLCFNSALPAGSSGYITSSCTDDTYQSDQCTSHCVDLPVPDVVYNSATGRWACCGVDANGEVDCANPTDETFEAAAPGVLLAATSLTASSTASSLIILAVPITTPSTPIATTTISSNIPPASTNQSSLTLPKSTGSPLTSSTSKSTSSVSKIPSLLTTATATTSPLPSGTVPPSSQNDTPIASTSLSMAAKSGIGVGTALSGLILLSLLTWLIVFLIKKRRKAANVWEFGPPERPEYTPQPEQGQQADWIWSPGRHMSKPPEETLREGVYVGEFGNEIYAHTRRVPVGRWQG